MHHYENIPDIIQYRSCSVLSTSNKFPTKNPSILYSDKKNKLSIVREIKNLRYPNGHKIYRSNAVLVSLASPEAISEPLCFYLSRAFSFLLRFFLLNEKRYDTIETDLTRWITAFRGRNDHFFRIPFRKIENAATVTWEDNRM